MHYFQPRNTLVLVRLIKKSEEKVGQIVVKTENDQFSEAEVMGIGPDCIAAAGGQSSTHDLKVGQRVLVQSQTIQPGPGGLPRKRSQGLELKESETGGQKDLFLFEQTNVMAILAQPEEIK